MQFLIPEKIKIHGTKFVEYFSLADISTIYALPILILTAGIVNIASWYICKFYFLNLILLDCNVKIEQHMLNVKTAFFKTLKTKDNLELKSLKNSIWKWLYVKTKFLQICVNLIIYNFSFSYY